MIKVPEGQVPSGTLNKLIYNLKFGTPKAVSDLIVTKLFF